MSFKVIACSLLVVALFSQGCVKGEFCAGCPVEYNPKEDSNAQKWVGGVLNSLNTNSAQKVHLRNIFRATKQVVNGVLYTFDIATEGEESNCIGECRIVLLWQPWITKEPQLVSQNCTTPNNKRPSRQLLGGLKEVDPSEMDTVRELADYAVSTLDTIDTDNSKQVVSEIIDAKKQLVNGIMFYLELRVKSTSCVEDKESNADCVEKEVGPEKLCKIQVHRSWADKSPLNAKVVKSECEPILNTVLGGIEPMNQNSDYIQQMLPLAMQRINEMTNSIYLSGLVQITQAATQVVAGTKVYLTLEVGETQCTKNFEKPNFDKDCSVPTNSVSGRALCNVVIWDKPWEHFRRVLSCSCTNIRTPSQLSAARMKRDMMTGGPVNIDPNDDIVKDVSSYVLSEMDKETNSDHKLGIYHILSATSQVVAGVKITVKMAVGETSCLKGVPTNGPCIPNSPQKICTVVVWDRPWLNDKHIVSQKCGNADDSVEAVGVPGGVQDVSVNSPTVLKLKNFVGESVTSRINSEHTLKVTKVLGAQSQVVEGLLVKMIVEVSSTNCLTSENKDPAQCTPDNKNVKICSVDIWEREWLQKTEVTQLHCHQPETTQLDMMTGGPINIDPNDEIVKDVSSYVLSEMDKETNSDHKLGVYHILSATSQVVAGVKITVKMAVGETSCLKGVPTNGPCIPNSPQKICTIVVWDRPWLKEKQILSQRCENSNEVMAQARAGGVQDISVNSPTVLKLKNLVGETVTSRTNSEHTLKVTKVLGAQSQVVAGQLVKMIVEVSNTNCLASENADPAQCTPTYKDLKICSVSIWERPWLNKTEVTELDCHNKDLPVQ